MSQTEFDGILKEDLERFKELLISFYGASWEESYVQFTKEISERLRRKDTNIKYRSHFESNLNDLVLSVVSRFIRINSKLERAGQKIHSFYAMLENRIGHVYHEELRRLSKLVPLPDIDDSDIASETDSADKEMEQKEKETIKTECYKKCLDDLPMHISIIFVEYYDTEELTPAERTYARQRLALKLANIPPSEATPEKLKRARNNLDSMISKWRRKHLEPCKEKCLKQRSSDR
ncbi:MAG TPA: hypothetical protein VLB68_01800 [Pyrinomonadaceae bacterium]|nr:hypothetical protein [Pyrinomonadaceae bacterium]